MSDLADQLLQLRGWPALGLAFALPAAESAIFLGFVIPGETAAVLAGVLAYEGRLNLAAAMLAVVAGAVIGDTIGYAVGRRWGTRLLEGPLSRWIRPARVERSRATIERRGGWAVLLGRFTAALRALVPGLAGMARLPYRTFLLYNLVGGALWGCGFVLLGYLAGASWRTAAKTAGTAGLVTLTVVVLAVVVVVVVRRRRRLARTAGGCLDRGRGR